LKYLLLLFYLFPLFTFSQEPFMNQTEQATLGGGCFWCVEAIFQRVNGVKELTNGYYNGLTQNPSYEEICSGQSNHAEVLKVDYDEQQISYSELLEVFVETHDPTSLNQQGADKGTQYRSAVFILTSHKDK